MAVLGGVTVSYERGTPVGSDEEGEGAIVADLRRGLGIVLL